MKTVARLTAECQLMNLHQYQDTDGNLRGCSGSCLGNDETTAIGNYAGDQVRILCSCECHRVIDEEDFPSLEAERIQTYQSCRCPSARCVCQGGAQCACACSVGVDPNICVGCRPDSQPGPKVRVPTHEETCAGCYEVAPGVFIHPKSKKRRQRSLGACAQGYLHYVWRSLHAQEDDLGVRRELSYPASGFDSI